MIVLERDNTLLLIRQPDHAAMAAAMARAWRRPTMLPAGMWDRFIDAVRRHDDGWIAAEQKPALDADGRPFDFKRIPSDQHLSIWRRSVDLASRDDAYACLLVAHHARYLYTHTTIGNDDNPAAAQGFINELAVRIVRCTEPLELGDADEQAAIAPRAVNVARRLLTAFDWLSLALLGALPHGSHTEALAFGDVEATPAVAPTAHGAALSPWPFEPASLSVECPAVTIAASRHTTPKSLADAVAGAAPQMLRFTLQAA